MGWGGVKLSPLYFSRVGDNASADINDNNAKRGERNARSIVRSEEDLSQSWWFFRLFVSWCASSREDWVIRHKRTHSATHSATHAFTHTFPVAKL